MYEYITMLGDQWLPNISLELTGLSWGFAGFDQVAAGAGERRLGAWAALQLSSDRWAALLTQKRSVC